MWTTNAFFTDRLKNSVEKLFGVLWSSAKCAAWYVLLKRAIKLPRCTWAINFRKTCAPDVTPNGTWVKFMKWNNHGSGCKSNIQMCRFRIQDGTQRVKFPLSAERLVYYLRVARGHCCFAAKRHILEPIPINQLLSWRRFLVLVTRQIENITAAISRSAQLQAYNDTERGNFSLSRTKTNFLYIYPCPP